VHASGSHKSVLQELARGLAVLDRKHSLQGVVPKSSAELRWR